MFKKHQRIKTLAQQVRWQLLWLGGGLFLACLVLLFVFAWRATELTTTSLMQLEAKSLARQAADHPELPLASGKTFSAYRQWEAIPESLRQHFDNQSIVSGEIIEASFPGDDGDVEYLYLLHYIDNDNGELFLLSHHQAAEVEVVFIALFKAALNQALGLTLIIFVALFFLISWLIRRTTEPLALLSQWASTLGENPEQPSKVNFAIEELNQIAAQLHEGVDRIQAFNQREKQFLKHASHELRTPLAIIQASLDTLDLQNGKSDQPAVQRALRASANMRRLSAALLWLARESERPINKSLLDLRALCDQIIDDHRYLLSNRDIEIRTHINIDILEIESDLFSIVMANLVRNAFQYAASGIIEIEVSLSGLRIVNSIKPEADLSILGFGLGLQLVQRICHKLDWQFYFNKEQHFVVVTVAWYSPIEIPVGSLADKKK